jgi:hypothetical protein
MAYLNAFQSPHAHLTGHISGVAVKRTSAIYHPQEKNTPVLKYQNKHTPRDNSSMYALHGIHERVHVAEGHVLPHAPLHPREYHRG